MAHETNTTATLEVPPRGGLAGLAPTSAIDISGTMVVLTWISFLLAAFLLHRLAWRPLLRALDKREREIRNSLEEAETARRQTELSAERSRQLVAEAMDRARALSEESRLASERAAARLDQEAREQARRLVDDANQEIAAARLRAVEELRREAATLAVQLSERMLDEQMTPEQRRAYEQRMAGKMPS
jgi:F-type H+-transporting ATPase subunit b